MRGVVLEPYSFASGAWKPEYMDKLQTLGFDSVAFTLHWGQCETYDGVIQSTGQMSAIRSGVNLAKQAGLSPYVGVRVSYPTPTDNIYRFLNSPSGSQLPTPDYVNMTEEGRQRYARFLSYVAEAFSDCAIILWFYPYHGTPTNVAQRQMLYNVTYPVLIDAVPNEKVVVPVHQGEYRWGGNVWNTEMPGYGNVTVGGVSHCLPDGFDTGSSTRPFDDAARAEIDAVINRAKSFGGPICSVEFLSLKRVGGGWSEDRRDAGEYAVDQMSSAGFGWFYWRLNLHQEEPENLLSDRASFTVDPVLFDILDLGISPVFSCSCCDLDFSSQAKLDTHKLTHTCPPGQVWDWEKCKCKAVVVNCFIVTACGASDISLGVLRSFRDKCMPKPLILLYYLLSPALASLISTHKNIKVVGGKFWNWLAVRLKKSLSL